MVIAALLLYMGCLFVIALWVERRGRGRNLANSAYIYALSLAIYFTSWTFYGGVGKATTSGMLFLTPYVGSMLSVILWWIVLRKLIRLKTAHRIASIADLISARYGKSRRIAAMVTFMALVGSMPYVALQLKATSDAVAMISAGGGGEGGAGWFAELVIVVSMVVFTIMFGVRRLDPTERHEGMVVALAAQCAVKLVAFLVVGIFVTYFAYDGIGDILGRVRQSQFREMLSMGGRETTSYLTWTSYLVLSFSAVLFLPRQFHIAVVENPDEQHTRTAMWLFPAYMFLITLFVVPIAAGGLLKGLPVHQADTFVIGLPLKTPTNPHWCCWFSLAASRRLRA